jgi:hypothetical protein
MKIENQKFYVLDVESEKEIYKTEPEAIQELKTQIQGKKINENNVSIMEVDVSGDWKISQVSWSKIAMELLRGG